MKVYNNPYSAFNVQNNQNKVAINSFKNNGMSKDNISFGLNDKAFIEDVLNKTVKGSKKLPSVADNICFEVDQPTPGKKQAVLDAIKKADEWYKEVLEDLARDWGLKVD
ncbi:MAG: hypothetical protein PHC34_08400 [Candidatus Gastranaerophilales bacterium]|nr:hypothetical protein [Candidatus Gastranaerophilales bacterium]